MLAPESALRRHRSAPRWSSPSSTAHTATLGQSRRPLAARLCCSLLLLLGALSPSLALQGAYEQGTFQLPVSTWFSDASFPQRAFASSLPFATGLVDNGSLVNIAVPVQCSSYTNPKFTHPIADIDANAYWRAKESGDTAELLKIYAVVRSMFLTADEILHCDTGFGVYDDLYYPFVLLQSRINSLCNGGIDPATAPVGECGIPMANKYDPLTGHQFRAKLNIVYLHIGPFPTVGTPDAKYAELFYDNTMVLSDLLSASDNGETIGNFTLIIPTRLLPTDLLFLSY